MILVTGASGFLGKHLLEALVPLGLPIRALYNRNQPSFLHPLISWQACDLLDVYAVEEAMLGIQYVYHCAAIVSFDKKDKQIVIVQNKNATAHVVNEALNANVKRLIHISSIAALGRTTKSANLISEETHWVESDNNTAYAKGKYQAEMEVWRGMAEGLNAAILNPGIILGEGNYKEGSAKLFESAYQEFPWYTNGINGWVDVKDVAKAAILLMQSDIVEERYVLCGGNYSYKNIFTWMAQSMNKKPPYKHASPFMSKIAWFLSVLKAGLSGQKSILTKETVRTAQAISQYDNSKFLKEFSEFSYIPMENTIKRVSKDFLNNI